MRKSWKRILWYLLLTLLLALGVYVFLYGAKYEKTRLIQPGPPREARVPQEEAGGWYAAI